LLNGLSNASLGFTKEQIQMAIAKCDLPPAIRGEALTLKQFARLSDVLQVLRQ
jgi:hypothetical protein